MKGGVYNITSTHNGIKAETNLTISGGKYTIKTGGASTINTSDSYKGLKAVIDITIIDGTFIIDARTTAFTQTEILPSAVAVSQFQAATTEFTPIPR